MNCAVKLNPNVASYKSQLFGEKEFVKENEEIAKARGNYMDNPSLANLISLVKALNLSLLYRESVNLLKEGIKRFDSIELKKMLAVRLLTTNEVHQAKELYLSLESELDSLYVQYRLGLASFYERDFKEAERYFYLALKAKNLNEEMEVALFYWLILARIEQNENYIDLLNEYKEKDVGHHYGYLLFILFLKKELTFEDALNKAEDDLTLSILLSGTFIYSLTRDEKIKERSRSLLLTHDRYWASFSSLPFYYLHYNQ